MKVLKIIHEEEIYLDTLKYKVDKNWVGRIAVKMIVFDEHDKIALVGVRYLLLPGGGVEKGETIEDAVVRECLEEVGCDIKIIREIGIVKDFRLKAKRKQETHCFVAKIAGKKGAPQTTQEDEQGLKVEWLGLNDALELLKKQKETISILSYHTQFNIRAHIAFIDEYIRQMNK